MQASRIAVLCGLLAPLRAHGQADRNTAAVRDTVAVRATAAAHYAVSDSAVSARVAIRADTAWVHVWLGQVSGSIARVERLEGRWRFVREDGFFIR